MSWLSEALGQDAAKEAKGYSKKATQTAEEQYADRALYRNTARNAIANPKTYDLSSIYGDGPQAQALNDPLYAKGAEAQMRALSDVQTSPDRMAMVKAALAELDTENALQRNAGAKKIGQSAASLGRIGNQGVTTSLGNLESDIQRNRGNTEAALLRDMVEAGQNDKYKAASLAGDITDSAYRRAASERENAQSIAQIGIDNRAKRFAAERGAQGQDFGQSMSLAGFGAGASPEDAYNSAAATAAADQGWLAPVLGMAGQVAGGWRSVRKPKAGAPRVPQGSVVNDGPAYG